MHRTDMKQIDMYWIDMHCDTLSELMKVKNGNLQENTLCVDIKRLKQIKTAAQFFACYVNMGDFTGGESVWDRAYERVLSMTDYARKSVGKDFSLAYTAEDIFSAVGKGKVSGILTVEEGGVLNGKPERLEELYGRGVRLITLTWNYRNCIGSPNSREPEVMRQGLTRFGLETVERMNEMGMIIDVSHLSDGGVYDCIRKSSVPIVASHSNARALCPHPRNLTDEMLHALGEKGGVVGVNFYSPFLKERGGAGISDIARHAAYMTDKAGEDAVALGSDLDGFDKDDLPDGINGIQDMGGLWAAFEKADITPRQIEKIMYKNAMRVLGEVLK